MPESVIGKTFTFEVLFLDNLNNPMAVNNPHIVIYMYNQSGTKVTMRDEPLVPVLPAEVGRYVYPYLLPLTLVDGDVLYGEMTGLDVGTGVRLIVEQTVTAIAAARGLTGGVGLTARFV